MFLNACLPMASEKDSTIRVDQLDRLIYEIRGQKVMLDRDLAEVFGVDTKVLNQAVKRNRRKFPPDFMFQLTAEEFETMRSQFVTASNRPASRSRFQTQRQVPALRFHRARRDHGGQRPQ